MCGYASFVYLWELSGLFFLHKQINVVGVFMKRSLLRADRYLFYMKRPLLSTHAGKRSGATYLVTKETYPHTKETYPHTKETYPQTKETYPHTKETYPHTKETYPHT